MDKKWFGIISFSVLIESLITYFNSFFVAGVFHWQMTTGLFLGVLIAIAYDLDLLSYFNFKSKFPYLNYIITGILISRGSNYIFDLIGKLTSL